MARPRLEHWFDQVWVVSLKRRPDRVGHFWAEIQKANWPFHQPQLFNAIDGDKVGMPRFWQTGGGSYGCLRSHLIILERAIMDDVESSLVLEDDAVFMKTFAQDAAEFLAKVPEDWQCLMLGGQHVNSEPIPVAPGIVRAGGGGGIQRTHCYALRGAEAMKALYRTWANAAVHCDWVMGPCMAKFKTYAPDPFLVGQADGHSDISGALNPAKFWRPPNGNEPVLVLHAPREVVEAVRKQGFHAGYTRDAETGIDVGLRDLFTDEALSAAERNERLEAWIRMIQWEVASMAEPAICTVWHPEARGDMVRPLVRGKVVEVSATTVEEVLDQLPADIFTPVREVIRVVLLRASREVMECLRHHGWHSGHWRDPGTGQDNGVRQLFSSTKDRNARRAGLHKIVRVLHDEVLKIPDGIVALWHDEITPGLLEADNIHVIEIAAASPEEAIAKLKESTHAKSA